MPAHLRKAALFLFLLVFAQTGVGAETWPVPRGPSREPVPYQYDPKVWAKVPRAFLDDASAVILYTGTSHLLDDDGTVETITHEITRLNGRKGIDALGEYRSIYFDPAYQKLTLNLARVLKADGAIVPIEPKHVQLRDVATDYQIYDQDRQLVISFPNLEVGDVYEIKWTVRGKNSEFAGKFFSRYTFGDDTNPTVQDELHVLAGPKLPLKHATLNGKVDLKVADLKGKKHYNWQVTNRSELPRDDDKPSKEELRLHLSLSTFASWDEVAQWKQKLRAECWKCTPQVAKIVEEVTCDQKTPVDKAKALTYWVRRNVRYLSRGPAGAGYTPHLPHQVLTNRFGDCKDQAQLLAVMFRQIGLSPYLVTLGTLDDGQVSPEVPSPWGTHAILMVPIDGKEYWIDTTVSQAAWNYLPRADRDRQAYLTRDAELKLIRTLPMTYADNRTEQTTHVVIGPDGASNNQRTLVFQGGSALSRRDTWIEVPPGERRRLMTAELQDSNSRTRLLSLNVEDKNLLDFDQPLRAQVAFQIPRHFTGETVKEGSLTDSLVWSRLLSYNFDPERGLPLHLGGPFESIHRYLLQAPPAFRFDDPPQPQEVVSPWGFFKLKVQPDAKDPRRLELVMHTRLEIVRVEPKDFAAFQKFHEEVNKAYRVWVNLRPATDLADAPLLEVLLALAPGTDPISPGILARLYLDNDKFEDARRVLDQACSHHAQDAGLWDLRVKAAANLADEEQVYAAMVRAFPKKTKLAVNLGAVKVKRHDHAGARKILMPLTADLADDIRALAHYHLAQCYFQEKHYQAALKHLEVARLSVPQILADAPALHFKARVHEQLGQIKEAIATYRELLGHGATGHVGQAASLALQTGGASATEENTLMSLIRLELKTGQKTEALDHLRRFTLAAGKDLAGLNQAAEFHFAMGRLEDAFELANRARDLGFAARTQKILGLVHFRKKEFDHAVFHLDRADADADVLECLLRSYLALGDLPAAEKHGEAAKNLLGKVKAPGLANALDLLKGLAKNREDLWKDLAAPPEKKVLALGTINQYLCADLAFRDAAAPVQVAKLLRGCFPEGLDLGPAYALRALLWLDKGNLHKAQADAHKALQLKPADARAYLVRGRIRLERREPGALGDLERAATLSGQSDAIILHWLAAALFDARRPSDALTAQRRAVQLCPGDADLADQLREYEKSGGQ